LFSLVFGDTAGTAQDSEAIRARGEYLTKAMDCGACHTPWKMGPKGPQPDAARLLSGHPENSGLPAPPVLPPGPWNVVTAGNTAWAGPWGISYATNLTPDEETGIGAWTDKMFSGSMRTGTHLGMGRDVLPPMPRYPELTDEDLHAIFTYLMSIPAIKNRVPDPEPPRAGE
jgi:mono/diheme cytochrome c family protein